MREVPHRPLPPGWVRVELRELLREPLRNGHSARASSTGEGVRTLTLSAVTNDDFGEHNTKLTVARPDDVADLWLQRGDLLIERSNTPELVGTAALYSGSDHYAIYPDLLIRVRLHKELSCGYMLGVLQLRETRKYFRYRAKGLAGSMPKIDQGTIESLSVPLAPALEQRRIVAKIEELLSDLDAGVAALERAKANLRRYRAAVLKAAVEGRLTAAWRERHPATEPASKLLERILAERRKRWEAEQEAKFAASGKTPPKGWREKYAEPTPPDTRDLPELPEGWCWASVQQVGSVQLGRQRSPQHHSGPHMRPYLRVANVFEDRIDISDVMEMNYSPQEFETFRLAYGDILLNEGQSMELVGRPAMYRNELPGACFTNSLVRFRVYDGVDTNYALKVFLAYLKNGRFQKSASITVNIAHLGAGRFSDIEFPLPPVEEQAAIIEEVDHHLSLIESAEKAITLSLARSARLRQSILKRAFEGKLVPQDPTDEPASALLERIRAARNRESMPLPGDRPRGHNGQQITSPRRKRRPTEVAGDEGGES